MGLSVFISIVVLYSLFSTFCLNLLLLIISSLSSSKLNSVIYLSGYSILTFPSPIFLIWISLKDSKLSSEPDLYIPASFLSVSDGIFVGILMLIMGPRFLFLDPFGLPLPLFFMAVCTQFNVLLD